MLCVSSKPQSVQFQKTVNEVNMLNQTTNQAALAHGHVANHSIPQRRLRCSKCTKSLSISQEVFVNGVRYKSCPCCSQAAGEHVFYPLDKKHFGFSKLRATPNFPDGRQSHCTSCRHDGHRAGECTFSPLKYAAGIMCSEL